MYKELGFVREVVVYDVIQHWNVYTSGLWGEREREREREREKAVERNLCHTHSDVSDNHHHGCLVVELGNVYLAS